MRAHWVLTDELDGRRLTGRDDAPGIAGWCLERGVTAVIVRRTSGAADLYAADLHVSRRPAAGAIAVVPVRPAGRVGGVGATDAFAAGLISGALVARAAAVDDHLEMSGAAGGVPGAGGVGGVDGAQLAVGPAADALEPGAWLERALACAAFTEQAQSAALSRHPGEPDALANRAEVAAIVESLHLPTPLPPGLAPSLVGGPDASAAGGLPGAGRGGFRPRAHPTASPTASPAATGAGGRATSGPAASGPAASGPAASGPGALGTRWRRATSTNR